MDHFRNPRNVGKMAEEAVKAAIEDYYKKQNK